MAGRLTCDLVDEVPARAYDALEEFEGGTLFHTRAWHRVLETAFGWRVLALRVRQADRLRAWLPVVRKRRLGRRVFVALPLSHAVGFAVEPGFDLAEVSRDDLPRPLEVHAAVPGAAFRPVSGLVQTRLDLTVFPSEEALLGVLHKSKRRDLRAAWRKDVHAVVRRDPEAFAMVDRLHLETRRRQGAPTYPPRFFERIHAELATRSLAAAHLVERDGRPVAVTVFIDHGDTSWYGYAASVDEREMWRLGVNLEAMWSGLRTARERGFAEVDFGSSPAHQSGLIHYKEHFGGATRPLVHSLAGDAEPVQVAQDGWMARAGGRVLRSLPLPLFRHMSPWLLRAVL